MTQVKQWRCYFTALMLFGLAVFSCGVENRPAQSSDHGGSGPGLQEGVVGQVTTSDGRPVKGAFVQPRSLGDPSPRIPEIAILTDTEGRYTWPLFPGTYEISVSAEGYRREVKQVAVETGQVVSVDFTLQCEDL